ncbi:carbon storage regulator [Ktedonobacter racemifer]|uniref:Translational regulator CsrA n=1 Tax=Ktedonobacter racemifer DSM 44963 TaxID=485913 RepID=D6TXG9_KTERA|nr:carbon storage regulator [Ktedonobacter racemifer]EFH84902.1 carbon storage regulator, CsrA [Ktedonobacter racemifer DSM 44963]
MSLGVLVIRRKEGESIILSGTIHVKVLEVNEGRVKIGITAPPEVDIVREEIVRRGAYTQHPDTDQSDMQQSAQRSSFLREATES